MREIAVAPEYLPCRGSPCSVQSERCKPIACSSSSNRSGKNIDAKATRSPRTLRHVRAECSHSRLLSARPPLPGARSSTHRTASSPPASRSRARRGWRVLQRGGNAIDAAVTAAAVLSVTEPMMTGIGGDMFAMVWIAKEHRLVAINASGRAGALMTREALLESRAEADAARGAETVTVPGALAGWDALLKKYGTITLAQALAPAIRYAEEGYPVTPIISRDWKDAEAILARDSAAKATFMPSGHAPARRRMVQKSGLRAHASRDRVRRHQSDVRRRARRTHREARAGARRLSHARGSQGQQADVGDADLGRVQGLSHLGAAAEQSGHRHARDAEDPRAVRSQGDGTQLRAVPASSHRSEEARVRGSRAVRRRCGSSRHAAGAHALRCVHRRASQSSRRIACAGARRSGTGADRERDDLSHDGRQRRQHGVVHQQPVLRVRIRRRRAGHRLRAAQSRRGIHAGAGTAEHRGAGQASVPHAHSGVRLEAGGRARQPTEARTRRT